jgi:hypothetical protein
VPLPPEVPLAPLAPVTLPVLELEVGQHHPYTDVVPVGHVTAPLVTGAAVMAKPPPVTSANARGAATTTRRIMAITFSRNGWPTGPPTTTGGQDCQVTARVWPSHSSKLGNQGQAADHFGAACWHSAALPPRPDSVGDGAAPDRPYPTPGRGGAAAAGAPGPDGVVHPQQTTAVNPGIRFVSYP